MQLGWSEKKLRDFLKKQKEVSIIHEKPLRFTMKSIVSNQKSLFD
jgi:hypothetical protein